MKSVFDTTQEARWYADRVLVHVDAAVYDESGPLVKPDAPTMPLITVVLSAYGKDRDGMWIDQDDFESDKQNECAEHLRAFVSEIAQQAYIAGVEAANDGR